MSLIAEAEQQARYGLNTRHYLCLNAQSVALHQVRMRFG